jgi:hypothetical protein
MASSTGWAGLPGSTYRGPGPAPSENWEGSHAGSGTKRCSHGSAPGAPSGACLWCHRCVRVMSQVHPINDQLYQSSRSTCGGVSDELSDNHRGPGRTLPDSQGRVSRVAALRSTGPCPASIASGRRGRGCQTPPPRPLVRRVSVSRLGVGCRWRGLCPGVTGFGTAGTPSAPRPSLVSVSYSAGQQPFEPVPLRLSCTRSGRARGTASRDPLCVITGADRPHRWGGSRRSRGGWHDY